MSIETTADVIAATAMTPSIPVRLSLAAMQEPRVPSRPSARVSAQV